jgi:hypothetical protein
MERILMGIVQAWKRRSVEGWKVGCYQDLALDFVNLKADEEQEIERQVPPIYKFAYTLIVGHWISRYSLCPLARTVSIRMCSQDRECSSLLFSRHVGDHAEVKHRRAHHL